MATKRDLFIDGEWLSGYGSPFSSSDPATGEGIWEGRGASQSDVGRAVKAAKRAAPRWRETPYEKRLEHLKTYRELLSSSSDRLARQISKETGKPLWESRAEAAAMQAKVDISIRAYEERSGERRYDGGHVARHRGHGAIAVLGPFNFPGHLPNGHLVPALLAGNSVIFKPSEETPSVGELLASLFEEAEFPRGVFNLIQGPGKAGKWLAEHAEIDGLFFTGSYPTGKRLLEHFSKFPEKILALEMGGNNPLVVSETEELEAAACLAIQSAYLTSGQRCSSARRLIVPRGERGDRFLELFVEMARGIRVGPPEEKSEPFMGPVISTPAAVRLFSKQAAYKARGGLPLLEMGSIGKQFNLLSPGLMDVTRMEPREDVEIFGPFLQLIRVSDFSEAIEKANETRFGLSAALFSDRREEWELFYREVKAGIINWNSPTTGAISQAPFGGVGLSGNHRPSAYYAADYSAFPVVSCEKEKLELPESPPPGIPRCGTR